MYYEKIADSMKLIAEEIEDIHAKESINKNAYNLKVGGGGGGVTINLFANLWFALDFESKLICQNGIFNQIARGEYYSDTLWLTEFSLNEYGFISE